jgi:peptidoglycan/LPS O-acetylase OafA/YrhL
LLIFLRPTITDINTKPLFPNLDTIRFIAAAMVFLQHSFKKAIEHIPVENEFIKRILYVICNGEFGVTTFFILSGFLITFHLYYEKKITKTVSLPKFYARRVLRIWPLFFFIVIFTCFLYPQVKALAGFNKPVAIDWRYHISFLSNFDVIRIESDAIPNGEMSQNITWSVSIEEQFYAFWPLIFFFFPLKLWKWIVAILIIGSVLFRIQNHSNKFILYYHTASVLLDLCLGGLAAILTSEYRRLKNYFETNSGFLLLAFLITTYFVVMYFDKLFDFPYGNVVGHLFTSLLITYIISDQSLTKRNTLNLFRFSFATKWGKYSYGMYLIHPIVITAVNLLIKAMGLTKTDFFTAVVATMGSLLIVLFLSKKSYSILESPFLALKKRFEI